MQLKSGSSVLLALMGVVFTPFAQAHIVTTETMGLLSGVVHPLTGADHVLAAVAAGIWAAVSGGFRARSVIAAFLGMLGLGAVAGFTGAPAGAGRTGDCLVGYHHGRPDRPAGVSASVSGPCRRRRVCAVPRLCPCRRIADVGRLRVVFAWFADGNIAPAGFRIRIGLLAGEIRVAGSAEPRGGVCRADRFTAAGIRMNRKVM